MIQDRLKNVAFAAVAAATALWVGCTDTLSEQETLKKSGQVRITLSAESSRQVEVKSISNINETGMDNLWVIQIGSDGNVIGTPDYNNLGTGSNDDFVAGANGTTYTVNVQVDENTEKICFIANAGNSAFSGCSTLDDIKQASRQLDGESSLANPYVVMSGVWNSTDSDFTVEMYRAIAKVDFTLTTGTGVEFALHSVQVYNVPTHLYYYREPDEFKTPENITSTYPATGSGFMNYPETTDGIDQKNLTDPDVWPNLLWLTGTEDQTGEIINSENTFTYTWYLPENARGTGSAKDQRNKCAETAKAGEGEYCTYIKINGFYKSDNLVTKVSYDIYLGENNYNDYNVLRNSNYEVTTTILGLDRIDTRINDDDFAPQNYIDYTDNSMPIVVFANRATSNPYLYSATYTPEYGWRAPSTEELMIGWIYPAVDGTMNGSIWTNKLTENAGRWFVNLSSGLTKPDTQDSRNYWTVKDEYKNGFVYPYVQDNTIISRDEYGGVKLDYIRNVNEESYLNEGDDGTEPQYSDAGEKNKVASKFQVATQEQMADALKEVGVSPGPQSSYRSDWNTALNACKQLGTEWRMPTQRELMLIYILNSKLMNPLRTEKFDSDEAGEGENGSHIFYWSSTFSQSDVDQQPGEGYGWSVCFCTTGDNEDHSTVTGKTEPYTKTAKNYIRCVRDVTD